MKRLLIIQPPPTTDMSSSTPYQQYNENASPIVIGIWKWGIAQITSPMAIAMWSSLAAIVCNPMPMAMLTQNGCRGLVWSIIGISIGIAMRTLTMVFTGSNAMTMYTLKSDAPNNYILLRDIVIWLLLPTIIDKYIADMGLIWTIPMMVDQMKEEAEARANQRAKDAEARADQRAKDAEARADQRAKDAEQSRNELKAELNTTTAFIASNIGDVAMIEQFKKQVFKEQAQAIRAAVLSSFTQSMNNIDWQYTYDMTNAYQRDGNQSSTHQCYLLDSHPSDSDRRRDMRTAVIKRDVEDIVDDIIDQVFTAAI